MGFFLGFIACYILGGAWTAYLVHRHDIAIVDAPYDWADVAMFVIVVMGWPWFWKTTVDDMIEEDSHFL